MQRFSPASDIPVTISDRLYRQLSAYSLAAAAAGVSMLALPPQADAEIVFTKANVVIEPNGIYPLDLDGNRVVDFLILQTYFLGDELVTKEALGNAVQGFSFGPFASALAKGAWIGGSQGFVKSGYKGERMATVSYYSGRRYVRGPWAYVNNHYLGLKFKIHGEKHYGWARLSVAISGPAITATLTGYAYETVPKKRLRAGQKSENQAQGKKSLGVLARGRFVSEAGK